MSEKSEGIPGNLTSMVEDEMLVLERIVLQTESDNIEPVDIHYSNLNKSYNFGDYR